MEIELLINGQICMGPVKIAQIHIHGIFQVITMSVSKQGTFTILKAIGQILYW